MDIRSGRLQGAQAFDGVVHVLDQQGAGALGWAVADGLAQLGVFADLLRVAASLGARI